jgi:hypothetical protein
MTSIIHPKNYPPESVDAPNSDGETPLTLAAKKGFGTIFGILIQYSVDWTQGGGFEKKTLLHPACQSLSPILGFLLRFHIIRYLERFDDNGMTPFHYACSTGNEVALQKKIKIFTARTRSSNDGQKREKCINVSSHKFTLQSLHHFITAPTL